MRNDVAEPNFAAKKTNVRYQAMELSLVIKDVDASKITSLVSVGKGYFATASIDGNIKVWEPLKVSPIATISEANCQIDFMIPIVRSNDVNLIYVCGSKLKCFNVKKQRAVTLLEDTVPITAICQNQQTKTVINLGLANGKIKDYCL